MKKPEGMKKPEHSNLPLYGFIVAVFVAGVNYMQWNAMDRSMRLDQRAWIDFKVATKVSDAVPPATGGKVEVMIVLTNRGKTLARKVYVEAVAQFLHAGEDPDFVYDKRKGFLSTGIVIPAPEHPEESTLQVFDSSGKPFHVTQEEREELANQRASIVVFARATYDDIFGSSHWIRTCGASYGGMFRGLVPFAGSVCAAYNDADSK
jgi:hypothetical protein